MITTSTLLAATLLAVSTCAITNAEEPLRALTGTCSLSAATKSDEVDFRLERGTCQDNGDCNNTQTQEPLEAFSSFTLADLDREGAHVDAIIHAEAGEITCSGVVHDKKLSGSFTFRPDPAFVVHMQQMGFSDFDSEKLEAYTLFRIETSWIRSLQNAGVSGVDSGNLIALRIFHVDTKYIDQLKAMGYPTPDAGKLIALRVQGVDPQEVKQIRAMGYQPTLDELVQMRIFKITPEFIRSLQARGFNDLTISKMVQIRIFKLVD
jgi:hypothetical protein